MDHLLEECRDDLMRRAIERYKDDTRKIIAERRRNLNTGRRMNDAAWCALMPGSFGKMSSSPHSYSALWLGDHKNFDGDECLLFPCAVPGNPSQVKYNFKQMAAARAMLLKTQGLPKDPKAMAAHKCGNGHLSCVNPKHLYWATPKQNAQDRQVHDDTDLTKYEVSAEARARIVNGNEMPSVLAHELGLPVELVRQVRMGIEGTVV